MEFFLYNLWQVLVLGALLLFSALFSGSETAFFNLSAWRIQKFLNSENKYEQMAGRLVADRKRLLSTLLFSNMAVNVLYFSISSILVLRVSHQWGSISGAVAAGVSFLFIILFGEMLPKSISYANSPMVCKVVSLPCYVLVKILHPILMLLNFSIIEPIFRLTGATKTSARKVDPESLKALVDVDAKEGLISQDENVLLGQIIEMGYLKVRDVMRPRVDMKMCRIDSSCQQIRQLMSNENMRYVPVYRQDIDDIVGVVDLKDIAQQSNKDISEFVKDAHFIPEQTKAEALLKHFHNNRCETAIVVDEYGGVSGRIDLDEIIDELIGAKADGADEFAEEIGDNKYRLSANYSIRDWAQMLGIGTEQKRLTTIGGYVAAVLGKIPQQGDVASVGNLDIEVEKVAGHRVVSVIVSLSENNQ